MKKNRNLSDVILSKNVYQLSNRLLQLQLQTLKTSIMTKVATEMIFHPLDDPEDGKTLVVALF